MERTAYRITVTAPGMTKGHRFDLPAALVPTTPQTTVLEALTTASAIAQETLILRVTPVYEQQRPVRESQRRSRQRLRGALIDFLSTCTDPTARERALALKERLL